MKELDFSSFPPGTVTDYTTLVCLACIFDIFTKQIGLAPRSAYSEIKRYSPTIEELTSRTAVRPFFDSDEKHPRCPYCNAAKHWHARLDTHCIEGGKTTDAPRRKLLKSLEKKKDQFAVLELKSDSASVELGRGRRKATIGRSRNADIPIRDPHASRASPRRALRRDRVAPGSA